MNTDISSVSFTFSLGYCFKIKSQKGPWGYPPVSVYSQSNFFWSLCSRIQTILNLWIFGSSLNQLESLSVRAIPLHTIVVHRSQKFILLTLMQSQTMQTCHCALWFLWGFKLLYFCSSILSMWLPVLHSTYGMTWFLPLVSKWKGGSLKSSFFKKLWICWNLIGQ